MAQPLSSVLHPASAFEDDTGDSWPEKTDREEFDEGFYETEKLPLKNTKVEQYSFVNMDDKLKKVNSQSKLMEQPPRAEMKHSNSDDDLNALLKVKFTKKFNHILTSGPF